MGRKSTPQPLMLADPRDPNPLAAADRNNDSSLSVGEASAPGLSPADSRSPNSQRPSPFSTRFAPNNNNKRPQTARAALQPTANDHDQYRLPQHARETSTTPTYPPISSASNSPSTLGPPSQGLRHAQTEGNRSRRPSKSGFFSFTKSQKPSTNQLYTQSHSNAASRDQIMSRGGGQGFSRQGDLPYTEAELRKPIPAFPSLSDLSLSSSGDHDPVPPSPATAKKNKSKSFGLLSRSRSTRDEDYNGPQTEPVPLPVAPSEPSLYENNPPLRTAPVAQDRSFRDMMNSTVRNRSEDRAFTRDGSTNRDYFRDRDRFQHSTKENGASNFLSGLRNSSTRAADMISKGLFGKSTRSGSTTEKEPVIDDEHYTLKVINLPLVEQTRKTRISKRLENSRDKTEFWMPAFPWRAIDYLNYKGCDVEGLYRVPGSGPQIKRWQRKFDEQHDVNLFEAEDLYDINIIGSMLKAWLRELPDELFPKDAQDRIARECVGSQEVPQMLVDELSNLSPFNYYLLFAITCHLSLLLAHSDKNKMDFRNLCICFQPCMKIDAFCFKFLVCDWRDCWKGCKQEAKYIEDEYTLFDQPPPRGLSEPQRPVDTEGWATRQSSDSGRRPNNSNGGQQDKFSRYHHTATGSHSSISSAMSNSSRKPETPERTGELRPLSPIKPLSPIGF